MKKLFGIIIAVFMFSSIGHAKTTLIDINWIDNIKVVEVCTGGYIFIIAREKGRTGTGVSIVQVFDRNGKPETCRFSE